MLLSISSAMACAVSWYPELRMERMASCCGMISCGTGLLLRAFVPDAFPVAEALRDAAVAGDLVDDSDDSTIRIAPSLRPSGCPPDHLAEEDDGACRPGNHRHIGARGVEAGRQNVIVCQDLDCIGVAVFGDHLPPAIRRGSAGDGGRLVAFDHEHV